MITDDELRRLLGELGEATPLPEAGPEAVREAILTTVPPEARMADRSVGTAGAGRLLLRRPGDSGGTHRRAVLAGLAGTGAAAALLAAALLTGGTGRPSTPPGGTASATPSASAPAPDVARVAAGAARVPSSHQKVLSPPAARSGRDLVTTGTAVVTVPRDRLSAGVARLEAITASLGGYVARSDVREAGRRAGGTVVVDVPASRFPALTGAAGRLGALRSLTTSEQDVTGQVVDIGARLTALEGARSRLEALAGRAGSVSALLSVEDEITATQSEIDQLRGEQQSLGAEVADASLSVQLVVPPAPAARPRGGFARAWHDAVAGFLAALRGLVAASGPLLFALLAAALAGLLAWGAGRRAWLAIRRRRL